MDKGDKKQIEEIQSALEDLRGRENSLREQIEATKSWAQVVNGTLLNAQIETIEK